MHQACSSYQLEHLGMCKHGISQDGTRRAHVPPLRVSLALVKALTGLLPVCAQAHACWAR